jgi:hypothetical protein
MEVNTLKNRLLTREKEKAMLHEELDRREISKRGISIMWKFRGRIGLRLSRKIKYSLKNYRMRMKSLRVA